MATKMIRPAGGYMARAMQAVEVSRATKIAAIDERPPIARDEQQQPEPIRIIRKLNGRHQWVILASEAELTADERRQQYVQAFSIY